MSSLLIFITAEKPFDKNEVIKAISALDGVSNAREGEFIGAVFECDYTSNGNSTIVRLSESLKSISTEGLWDESLDFAFKLKDVFPQPLSVVDVDYSFHIELNNISDINEFKREITRQSFSD